MKKKAPVFVVPSDTAAMRTAQFLVDTKKQIQDEHAASKEKRHVYGRRRSHEN